MISKVLELAPVNYHYLYYYGYYYYVFINMIICYHLIMVACQVETIFLDYLSLVKQATHQYVYFCDAAGFMLRM